MNITVSDSTPTYIVPVQHGLRSTEYKKREESINIDKISSFIRTLVHAHPCNYIHVYMHMYMYRACVANYIHANVHTFTLYMYNTYICIYLGWEL